METESTSGAAHQSQPGAVERGAYARWLSTFDIVAKLVGAFSVMAGAIIASQFQSSMAASTLLSQREQADSSMRAAMFHDLIDPIMRSKTSGEIPVDREQLLVELLALNFHEHFELKPMMLHVDERLAHDRSKPWARESLRSVSRRILQRQLALLTKATTNPSPSPGEDAYVYRLEIAQHGPQRPPSDACSSTDKGVKCGYFDDLMEMPVRPSSKGAYILTLTVQSPDWENQTFSVLMRIIDRASGVSADHDFLLTWFDYPFTDNTLLADGTRFSLIIDQVKPDKKIAILKLVWFPTDYFSARERPTNYRQFRDKLGLRMNE